MTHSGLQEFITLNPDNYIEKAVELAGSAGRLADLKRGLREQTKGSKLCDCRGFTRSIENAFRKMRTLHINHHLLKAGTTKYEA